MKKTTKLATLVLVFAMLLSMAGCGKSYNTLEEWYADHPQQSDSMTLSSPDGGDMVIEMDIKGNDIIYSYKLNQQLFGLNADADQQVKATLDQNLETQRSNFVQTIDAISKSSKIDASLITVRLEYYNPGSDTPDYTQSLTK